jgi:hypothetical protein
MSADVGGRAGRLSDADLGKVMALMGGSDSVELKTTVPDTARRTTIAALPLDPVEAQPRQVFFFDTPDLALDQSGLVVRARRIQGGRGDTVVKLRPIDPTGIPSDTRRSAAFNVEVDAMPGGFVCSGSMKGRSSAREVADAVGGLTSIRSIFSKEQRGFFNDHAPAGIDFASLVALGPIFVLKATFTPPELPRRFVAELWLYPDGSRIFELSTKCLPREAFQVAAETRAYLAGRGVPLDDAQQTKTRTALEFFKSELKASGATPEVRPAEPPSTPGR